MPSNMAATLMKLGPRPLDLGTKRNELDQKQQDREMFTYRPFRYLGCLAAVCALSFALYAVSNKSWIQAVVPSTSSSTSCKSELPIVSPSNTAYLYKCNTCHIVLRCHVINRCSVWWFLLHEIVFSLLFSFAFVEHKLVTNRTVLCKFAGCSINEGV